MTRLGIAWLAMAAACAASPAPRAIPTPEPAAPALTASTAPSADEPFEPRTPAPALSPAASAGRAHFLRHCATCHGEDGRGQTKVGVDLGIADMTDPMWQDERRDRDMRIFIRRGVPARKQPPFGLDKLDDQALDDVVAFIRALRR